MPTQLDVTVNASYGQMRAAALLEKSLSIINRTSVPGKGPPPVTYELCCIGAGALNIFYAMFDKQDHHFAERNLFIPSNNLTLDVLLIPQHYFDSVAVDSNAAHAIAERMVEISRGLVYPYWHHLIPHLPHERELGEFFCPRPQPRNPLARPQESLPDALVTHHAFFDLQRPTGRLSGSSISVHLAPQESVTVVTLHPAHFFIRVLNRIRTESVEIRSVLNRHNAAKRRFHLNRQSAQVFLLRLFVELLEATDHCDPTKSDAIWKGSLEKALPRDQETLEEFARAVCVVLTDEVAELQAEWQVRLENVKDQDRVARYTDLLSRNLQAFEIAKSWLLNPVVPRGAPPNCYGPPPPPPPPPTGPSSSAPAGTPFVPGPRR